MGRETNSCGTMMSINCSYLHAEKSEDVHCGGMISVADVSKQRVNIHRTDTI